MRNETTMSQRRYILMTAARNESDNIGRTIESVVQQTILPTRWAIVSDASTDGTDDIVREYAKKYPWIELISLPGSNKRSFGAKVRALENAFNAVRNTPSDFIGILDADITFDPDYYERVIGIFEADARLGVCGGQYYNKVGNGFRKAISHPTHVPGAVQLFRRSCYEEIGGYQPIRTAGEDTVAEVRVRMNGWTTRSLPELVVWHHRRAGTGGGMGFLKAQYKLGIMDYNLGYHPVFMMVKSVSRLRESPYILSSLFRTCGFLRALLTLMRRDVSSEFVVFLRHEQWERLKALIHPHAPAMKRQNGDA